MFSSVTLQCKTCLRARMARLCGVLALAAVVVEVEQQQYSTTSSSDVDSEGGEHCLLAEH
jgi:hypothetical protein